MPICMANRQIALVLNFLGGGPRHSVMQAAPFSAFELHLKLFKLPLYLLPIGRQVLKAQLPQYVVKKKRKPWGGPKAKHASLASHRACGNEVLCVLLEALCHGAI